MSETGGSSEEHARVSNDYVLCLLICHLTCGSYIQIFFMKETEKNKLLYFVDTYIFCRYLLTYHMNVYPC